MSDWGDEMLLVNSKITGGKAYFKGKTKHSVLDTSVWMPEVHPSTSGNWTYKSEAQGDTGTETEGN